MKVLILHQHFNRPEKGGALRSYYLAKALVDRGIQTVVITGHNDRRYSKENVEGIEVHYLPVAYDNKFGFAERGYSFLKFAWKSARMANRIPGVDLCYAISVPLTMGLAAVWVKKWKKIPFLFEVGDLWPDAPIQMGFVQNYFFKEFLYGLEKFIYRQSSGIVALSTAIQSAIEEKIQRKTIHLIPNMADCEYYKPEVKDPLLEKKFNVEGKFVVSYIGAIGAANGLDYFIECANTSRKANLPIQFLMCGEGALLERLKSSANSLGLKNLSFVDFQDRQGVKEIMNVTDAAFVCYKDVPVLETGSPNKFFDGLAAGKLIVANFGGWIRKELDQNKCGVYVDPRQPADFVKKIKPFLEDASLLKEYQASSRRLGESKYSRAVLSEKFAAIVKARPTTPAV